MRLSGIVFQHKGTEYFKFEERSLLKLVSLLNKPPQIGVVNNNSHFITFRALPHWLFNLIICNYEWHYFYQFTFLLFLNCPLAIFVLCLRFILPILKNSLYIMGINFSLSFVANMFFNWLICFLCYFYIFYLSLKNNFRQMFFSPLKYQIPSLASM